MRSLHRSGDASWAPRAKGWAEYTLDLLETLFENDNVSEFRKVAIAGIQTRNPALAILNARIAKLQSMVKRLSLAEEPAAPSPAATTSAIKAGSPARRVRVFIGSSKEGLKVAEFLQVNLDHAGEIELWTQGVFQPSSGTLASLVAQAREKDFAVLVLTPDDMVEKRGEKASSPRDNVIFELGLFMGALSPERVFMVHSRSEHLVLPSDLAGITPVTYELHSSGNLSAALGAASTQIRQAMERQGAREPR